MINAIYIPTPQKNEHKPQPVSNGTNCKYQVKIRYNEYECMTKEEYAIYKNPPTPAVDISPVVAWIAGIMLVFLVVSLIFKAIYSIFSKNN